MVIVMNEKAEPTPFTWAPMSFPAREASAIEAAFGSELVFLKTLLETPLDESRAKWTNYAVALGAAAIKAAGILWLLVRIDQHQGAPTMAREVVELCARFIHCMHHGKESLSVGLQHEMKQLTTVQSIQSGQEGCYWIEVSMAMNELQALMKTLDVPSDPKPPSDCQYVEGMRESYGLLSLGAHSRPSALMERYQTHLKTHVVNLTEPQPRSYTDDYIRFAGNALYEAAREYLTSDLVSPRDRDVLLPKLTSTCEPFVMKKILVTTPDASSFEKAGS